MYSDKVFGLVLWDGSSYFCWNIFRDGEFIFFKLWFNLLVRKFFWEVNRICFFSLFVVCGVIENCKGFYYFK